jgi:hypothetical protein
VDLYAGKTLVLIAEEETNVKSLSIGVGGAIQQHIEPDHNDPRIWDVASSKILNVQLVDSRTFRLVTGLEPPATPVTADTYKKMGLPFYHLFREDGKLDGVAGSWGEIVGTKKVASQNMKLNKKPRFGHSGGGSKSSSARGWAVSKYLGQAEAGAEDEEEAEEAVQDNSFDFPVILLDVDDTIPKFKSVGGADEDGDLYG